MKEVAIITGASSGIGYEIALLFAKQKIDILIVARNKQRLDDIKWPIEQQFKITVYCVATDLSTSDGFVDIDKCVRANNLFLRNGAWKNIPRC